MSDQKITLLITEELNDERLDKALSTLPEISSRSRAQKLIEEGRVTCGRLSLKASSSVRAGETYFIDLPLKKNSEKIQTYDYPIRILYEDSDLMVINKPSGLVVHPSAGHENDTLVNALLHHTQNLSMKFGEDRPGIVHRLDKETSGTMVIAKNDKAHEALALQFQKRSLHRVYWALAVSSQTPRPSFSVQSFLNRNHHDRKKRASVRDLRGQMITDSKLEPQGGKWAVTHVTTIQNISPFSLFRIRLETGRTHQIRVHLSEQGFPLLGDRLYGAEKKMRLIKSAILREQISQFPRFFLHAAELGFTHPVTGQFIFHREPWPEKEEQFLLQLGFDLQKLNVREP